MPKPKPVVLSPEAKLLAFKNAYIHKRKTTPTGSDNDTSLYQRIQQALQIFKPKANKIDSMTYLIMYDITNNKIRTAVAKFLEEKGCMRIQNSVFISKSKNAKYKNIVALLKEINALYENEDSIVLVPIAMDDMRAMQIIGRSLHLNSIIDPPNTIFI